MNDESVLRGIARKALECGRVPASSPDRVWAGPGSGAECAICGTVTRRDQLELEIEFRNAMFSPVDVYFVHQRCYFALERERQPSEGGDGTRS